MIVFDRLGLRWGGSLLGFIALAMTPIPFVFYKYGQTLRRMSKLAPTNEEKYAMG
jgi:MFS transporter, DHA1 family, multidrug resistance protein